MRLDSIRKAKALIRSIDECGQHVVTFLVGGTAPIQRGLTTYFHLGVEVAFREGGCCALDCATPTDGGFGPLLMVTSWGHTRCGPHDKYDPVQGRKVAQGKAEVNLAYTLLNLLEGRSFKLAPHPCDPSRKVLHIG
jgi:hypothetical protein